MSVSRLVLRGFGRTSNYFADGRFSDFARFSSSIRRCISDFGTLIISRNALVNFVNSGDVGGGFMR
jgi:hypothetical protein